MRLQALAAGEGKQAADELAPLLGGTLGHAEHALLLVTKLGAALEQAEPADHRSKQVVEIVRDPAGQLPDRIHLLSLDQLAFERPLLADVREGAREFDRLSVSILEQHRLVEKVLVGSIGALPAIFDR